MRVSGRVCGFLVVVVVVLEVEALASWVRGGVQGAGRDLLRLAGAQLVHPGRLLLLPVALLLLRLLGVRSTGRTAAGLILRLVVAVAVGA